MEHFRQNKSPFKASYGNYIGGKFVPAISGKTFDTVNPATGAVLAQVAACGPEDVDFAVQKARDARALLLLLTFFQVRHHTLTFTHLIWC